MNGIHSDISTRFYSVGPVGHHVAESVSGDTITDPWYLRIGRKKDRNLRR